MKNKENYIQSEILFLIAIVLTAIISGFIGYFLYAIKGCN